MNTLEVPLVSQANRYLLTREFGLVWGDFSKEVNQFVICVCQIVKS